jgi:hypothetical protein
VFRGSTEAALSREVGGALVARSEPVHRAAAVIARALGISSALAGCIARPSGLAITEPRQVVHVTGAELGSACVPAGTPVTIELLDTLGTEISGSGQEFRARVVEPLRSSEGVIVVPAGALIEGHVAMLEQGATPLLALELTSIETTRGRTSIEARLRADQPVTLPPSVPSSDGILRFHNGSGSLVVPRGARLHLVLTGDLTCAPCSRAS